MLKQHIHVRGYIMCTHTLTAVLTFWILLWDSLLYSTAATLASGCQTSCVLNSFTHTHTHRTRPLVWVKEGQVLFTKADTNTNQLPSRSSSQRPRQTTTLKTLLREHWKMMSSYLRERPSSCSGVCVCVRVCVGVWVCQ